MTERGIRGGGGNKIKISPYFPQLFLFDTYFFSKLQIRKYKILETNVLDKNRKCPICRMEWEKFGKV